MLQIYFFFPINFDVITGLATHLCGKEFLVVMVEILWLKFMNIASMLIILLLLY